MLPDECGVVESQVSDVRYCLSYYKDTWNPNLLLALYLKTVSKVTSLKKLKGFTFSYFLPPLKRMKAWVSSLTFTPTCDEEWFQNFFKTL